MSTFYQTDHNNKLHFDEFEHLVEDQCQIALGKFKQILNNYALFHFSFLIILTLQILLTIALSTINVKSLPFAIMLASIFCTIFSYLIITYYFQGKKTNQFNEIKMTFFNECKKSLIFDMDKNEYHLSLANSAFQLTTYIRQKHVYAFHFPPFRFLEDTMLKISFFVHWRDILAMQELLMNSSIKEHITLILQTPTSLSAHISLANAYIAISKIYTQPADLLLKDSFLCKRIFEKQIIKNKFNQSTEKAIEELKVLDDLAPNDPWIHAQLANCYHHLEMPGDEIHEYEILINLRSTDKEILYRLGSLYFHIGKNASGLKIYERLLQLDNKIAKSLISNWRI